MKILVKYALIAAVTLPLVTTITSCKKKGCTDASASNYDEKAKEDDGSCEYPPLDVPATYAFTRNGETSVSYSGQTDRMNQLGEIKDKLLEGDGGSEIDAQVLLDMFANTGDNGNGNFSFSSTKQLKNKTFDPDVSWFEDLMNSAATASVDGNAGAQAADGTAGLITRSNGNTILVDGNGREFTQLIEKGLMGATFMYQILNTYLTQERIGNGVENTALADGKNYTDMEHHMDEAFGYFGAPVDFSSAYSGSGSFSFWAKYSNTVDPHTSSSDQIMTAFRTARAAIVAMDYTERDQQVDILHQELQKVAAATAIHYANEALAATDDGDRLHVLSECYAFTQALRYANPDHRNLTIAQVDELLNVQIGDNFWQVTTTGFK